MKLVKLERNKNFIIKTARIHGRDGHQETTWHTVFIKNGLVERVDRGEAASEHRRPETVVVNLGDLYVLPPLVDCHVHLALDGLDFTAARRRWEHPGELTQQVTGELQDTLASGVLAVRDGGDRRHIALNFRKMVNSGNLVGPLIRASVYALRHPDTYGSFLGRGTDTKTLDQALDQLVQLGTDQVKVIVSGVVSFKEYGKVGPVQYTLQELKTIVRGARERGLKVMAHASSDQAVALAAQAGVDTIEHGYFLKRSTLELLAEKEIAWIPTVIPVAAQLNSSTNDGANGINRYVIEKTVDRQLAMINEAAATGVTLGVGTDAGASGVRHGHSYHDELELYRKAGLSAAQILECATVNSAKILGLDWGRIEPGCPGAMIAVKGNPLENINALRQVKYIFMPTPPCKNAR